jgi:hypothetical protein
MVWLHPDVFWQRVVGCCFQDPERRMSEVSETRIARLTVIEEGVMCKIFFQNGYGGGWTAACTQQALLREVWKALDFIHVGTELDLKAPDWVKQQLQRQGYHF